MEITQKEVAQLIVIEKPDTFRAHFLCFLFKNKKLHGSSTEREVRLWQQNSWTASLYAVFIFTFNSQHHLINIKAKPNIYGKVFFSGIFVLLFGFFSWKLFYLYENERFWLYTGIVAVFMILYILFCVIVYQSEKRFQRQVIYEKLNIDKTD
ncbi:hypothetical protein [uncultured Kordia sp.]|uniref:hypothetical protein n=1 Tax=uncultured Kordia sp. TaxID=507699 RepID=UPI002610B0ED|nr:hypothetical protein [uncultured Kordia sp.]